MDQSDLAYMTHEVVKRAVLENWADYLADNIVRLTTTLEQAVVGAFEELSLLIAVDPKDLSLHEIGLMSGDAKPSIYSSDVVWFLQVPILDSSNTETLKDIEILVDLAVQAWLPIACGNQCKNRY